MHTKTPGKVAWSVPASEQSTEPGFIISSSTTPGRCCYYLHFTEEETEAGGGELTFPRSHSLGVAEWSSM